MNLKYPYILVLLLCFACSNGADQDSTAVAIDDNKSNTDDEQGSGAKGSEVELFLERFGIILKSTVNVKSCLNAFYIVLCVRFIYFFLRKGRMKEARKAPLIKPMVPKIKINGNCPILLPFVKPASAPILAPTLAP